MESFALQHLARLAQVREIFVGYDLDVFEQLLIPSQTYFYDASFANYRRNHKVQPIKSSNSSQHFTRKLEHNIQHWLLLSRLIYPGILQKVAVVFGSATFNTVFAQSHDTRKTIAGILFLLASLLKM